MIEDAEHIDLSIPFLLPQFSLRGRLIRLHTLNKEILNQHPYPDPVAKVLAEFLAVGAGLASLLKYKGVFTLQTKTSGSVNFVVVDVTHDGNIRGYAKFNSREILQKGDFKDLIGKGYLAFTVDQGLKIERYQGIVTLEHETLAPTIEHYFDQSEQLETKIFIASEKTEEGAWKSSVLLLQQMPSEKVEEETWTYVDSLLATLSHKEFLDFSTPYETLLYRLFHEGDVTVFEPLSLQAKCRCSKERIKTFLTTLSSDEIEGLLEKGRLKITCEFCNHVYEFGRQDLMTIH
ncbi:MAG: Hsp33 family molecular chaperone HslO [Alphaproteobacteria bacterium]|nr:Hsp33 family molecular chaperone HslO [Alphaproteobacteria bacterium]